MFTLVGRDRELAHLARALDRVATGRGSLQLLCGEPGIGKTRLADELATTAETRGMRVFWGRCWDSEGAPAYWPWNQILGAMARTGALARGSDNAELALLAGPSGSDPADAETARFQLFQRVTDLLRQATRGGPLLLVIDDLHWADHSSLALLQFLARFLRSESLLIVCTLRQAEAALVASSREVLGRIMREGEQIPLRRLGYDEVQSLLDESGVGENSGLVRRVFAHTEGNPLYVYEVANLLAAQQLDAKTALPIPLTIQETIRERLELLSPSDRHLLSVAAVLGQEIDVTLLAAVSGRPFAEVVGSLDGGRDRGLLVARAEGRYAFAHGLIREVLYADQPSLERTACHRRIAESLAHSGATPASGQAALAERAHHLLLSGPEVRAEAVACALSAARQAAALHAHEDAVELLERAHGLVAADGPVSLPLVCDLLRALGTTRMRAGDDERGRQACLKSIELARQVGDPERLALSALALGAEFRAGFTDPALIPALQEARKLLDPAHVALHARMLARLAAALQPALDASKPVAMAEEAIELARQAHDSAVLLEVIYSAMAALIDYTAPDRLLLLTHELTRLCHEANELTKLLRVHALSVFVHLQLGQRAQAESRILEHRQLAAELDLPPSWWTVPMLDAVVAVLDGRFADAERLAQEGERLAGVARLNVAWRLRFFREALLRTQEHDAHLQVFLPRLLGDFLATPDSAATPDYGRLFRWLFPAAAHARAGRLSEAARDAANIPGDALVNHSEVWTMELAAEIAAVHPSREWIPQIYERLLPRADHFFAYGPFAFAVQGPIARALALLADVMDRWSEAQRHFEHALARCRELGARPAAARTAYDYAAALLRRGDTAKAEPLCRLARDEADVLGMPGLLACAAALMHPSSPPAPAQPPDPEKIRRLGSYTLIRLLGRGGMGEVWLGEHVHLKRRSAVKLIRADSLGLAPEASYSEARRRFEREAQATAALSSPNTVQLFDFGVSDDGVFYYAMELLDGVDLRALVSRHGPIGAERTIHIVRQVCDSLAEAHHRGMVHRDIKPGNIFLCRSGLRHDVAKVLDFGLVRLASGSALENSTLTAGGVVPGTPAYIAPESALAGTFDARSDLYSLGCVMYWLLTGQLVFAGETPMEQVMGHIQRQPAAPSTLSELVIPAALDALVLACLAKDPAARPQSANELSTRLAACDSERHWTDERARRWWQAHEPSPTD